MKLTLLRSKVGYFEDDSPIKIATDDLTLEEIKSKDTQKLIDGMIAILSKGKNLGLAANQVGKDASIIVYRDLDDDSLKEMINPKIMMRQGKVLSQYEGCMSLPGFRAHIRRAKRISVKYFDRNGEQHLLKIKHNKLQAAIIQHEVEHLHGVTILDRATQIFEPR